MSHPAQMPQPTLDLDILRLKLGEMALQNVLLESRVAMLQARLNAANAMAAANPQRGGAPQPATSEKTSPQA